MNGARLAIVQTLLKVCIEDVIWSRADDGFYAKPDQTVFTLHPDTLVWISYGSGFWVTRGLFDPPMALFRAVIRSADFRFASPLEVLARGIQ